MKRCSNASVYSIGLSLFLLALAPAAITCGQEAVDEAKFTGTLDTGGTVNAATNFSPDGKVVTVLFDNLSVALGGVEDEALTATKTATLNLPVSGNFNGVMFTHHLRGFANAQDAQVTLLIKSGGTSQTFSLNKLNNDFFYAVNSTLASGAKSLNVTIEIQAARKTTDPEDGFNIQMDSLNISIKPVPVPMPICSPVCCQPVYINPCCCCQPQTVRRRLFRRR